MRFKDSSIISRIKFNIKAAIVELCFGKGELSYFEIKRWFREAEAKINTNSNILSRWSMKQAKKLREMADELEGVGHSFEKPTKQNLVGNLVGLKPRDSKIILKNFVPGPPKPIGEGVTLREERIHPLRTSIIEEDK